MRAADVDAGLIAPTTERRVPGLLAVVEAIASREVRMASARKLVRALFLVSLVPCLVLALVLIVRVAGEAATGIRLSWDPVGRFLEIQSIPVLLMALGLGTPIVAQDRAEEVLFLYATRPVSPAGYALGKLGAVALPSILLLLVPALLMAGLRLGILPYVDLGDTLLVVGKALLVSLLVGWGYAGLTVAASALTSRARWALLVSLGLLIVPAVVRKMAGVTAAFDPTGAASQLIEALFEGAPLERALVAACLLGGLGIAGAVVLLLRARKEMIP
jgi:ABC-type transport system involved in multi-copper enzyme maturation permease subunit